MKNEEFPPLDLSAVTWLGVPGYTWYPEVILLLPDTDVSLVVMELSAEVG